MKEDILQVQEIAKTLASPGEGEDGTGFFTYLLTTFKDPGIPGCMVDVTSSVSFEFWG